MKDFTPDQLSIIDAARPHIDALCEGATKLEKGVGVVGFVFQPTTGLVMHFGNATFPSPLALLQLHQILAIAAIRMHFSGDIKKIEGDNHALDGGVSDDIRESMAYEPTPEEEAVFVLADEMAKFVMMTPSGVPIPPELVAAAKVYMESRVKA